VQAAAKVEKALPRAKAETTEERPSQLNQIRAAIADPSTKPAPAAAAADEPKPKPKKPKAS
jgi:hypothetical protein